MNLQKKIIKYGQSNTKNIKAVFSLVGAFCLFLIGLILIIYGLIELIETSQVPVCIQPLQTSSKEKKEVSNQSPDSNKNLESSFQIQAEISGAVINPGVYQMDYGQRVGKIIDLAGGFTSDADVDYIKNKLNLAKKITDEEKIHIPFRDEVLKEKAIDKLCKTWKSKNQKNSANSIISDNCVSINKADAKTLKSLPGIGEKRAAEIVQNRPYLTIDELSIKKVIGESVLSDIKNDLCL